MNTLYFKQITHKKKIEGDKLNQKNVAVRLKIDICKIDVVVLFLNEILKKISLEAYSAGNMKLNQNKAK